MDGPVARCLRAVARRGAPRRELPGLPGELATTGMVFAEHVRAGENHVLWLLAILPKRAGATPETDLQDLRRQVEENLTRTQPRLGGHLSGGHRPGRVLRRAEGASPETSYYLPPEHWWHGRWFLILLAVLATIVVAQGLGVFPWPDNDSPEDDGSVSPIVIESTTTTFPTTTTTAATTTTVAPPPTTAVPTTAAPTAVAPATLPPTTAPPPPPPTTLPPATAAPTTRPVPTTRPPTTATTAPTTFFVPPPTSVPPEPGVNG